MTGNVSRFLEASRTDAALAEKMEAIGAEAATLVAARLSELSQGTSFPFSAEEVLAQSPLSDEHLDSVNASAMKDLRREFSIGPFKFNYVSTLPSWRF